MAEEVTYPSGPFPADAKDAIASFMREVGIANLSIKVLRKRLEAKYKIEFTSHKGDIQKTVDDLMLTQEFQKELARITKSHDEGLVSRGKKKKADSSPAKKAPAAKKGEAPAKKERGAKKEAKPDNYPKAALSAYFLFANDKRDAIKTANPTFKIGDIGKEVGNLWKSVSEAEKARYNELAAADKKRFEKEMEAFLAAGGERVKRGRAEKGDKKGGKKAKKEKDPNAPKRPTSAFMAYMNAVRPEIMKSGAKLTEVGAIASKQWKELAPEETKKYEDIAAKDKERFIRECNERGIKTSVGGAKKPAAKKKAKKADSDSSSDSDSDSSSSDSDSSSSDSDSSSSDSSSDSSSSDSD